MIIGAFILLIAALAFVIAELFVPAHGVLAILAGCCALAAVAMATYVNIGLGLGFGVAVVIAAPIVFFYGAKFYPHTPMGRRVLLAPPAPQDIDPAKAQPILVGDRGVALTILRPAGSVDFAGRRVNCVSEAEVIPAGSPVCVLAIQGSRVVVKLIPAEVLNVQPGGVLTDDLPPTLNG